MAQTHRGQNEVASGMDLQQYFSAREASLPATERGEALKVQGAGADGQPQKRTAHQRIASQCIEVQSSHTPQQVAEGKSYLSVPQESDHVIGGEQESNPDPAKVLETIRTEQHKTGSSQYSGTTSRHGLVHRLAEVTPNTGERADTGMFADSKEVPATIGVKDAELPQESAEHPRPAVADHSSDLRALALLAQCKGLVRLLARSSHQLAGRNLAAAHDLKRASEFSSEYVLPSTQTCRTGMRQGTAQHYLVQMPAPHRLGRHHLSSGVSQRTSDLGLVTSPQAQHP